LTRYIKAAAPPPTAISIAASFAELYAIMSAAAEHPPCSARLRGSTGATGKPQYRASPRPRIWTYLTRSLAHPALAGFREWYTANRPATSSLIYDLLATPVLIWRRLCSVRAAVWNPEYGDGDIRAAQGRSRTFERGYPAHMMGIDGTWAAECVMEDVSETGAKLTVEGSVEVCI